MGLEPHPLVKAHAQALAERLGRPAKTTAEQGLRAQDFGETFTFRFQDGSHATFYDALFIHAAHDRQAVVFTKHCGYFVFPNYVRVQAENGNVIYDGMSDG